MKKGILVVVILVVAISVIKLADRHKTSQFIYNDDTKLPADNTWMRYIQSEDRLLTILMASDNFVYGYERPDVKNGRSLTYNNVGTYLREKKNSVDSNKLVVVIRRAPSASYKNTVDMLDEMIKNQIPRYVLAEILPSEQKLVDQLK